MSFVISARTILQLGAELISSDAVALYELIKNAIDARSPDGVEVKFEVVIRESDFSAAMLSVNKKSTIEEVRTALLEKILPSAPVDLEQQFRASLARAKSTAELVASAQEAYATCNRIVVSDHGHGMSEADLRSIYLMIGTTSRTRSVRSALSSGDAKAPYLGEKGVGRLSAMRLGRRLHVETAVAQDTHVNVLNIDWQAFEDADDAPASSIVIRPTQGSKKKKGESFTKITISNLRAPWSRSKLEAIYSEQVARMVDPFSSKDGMRFPIRVSFNGTSVETVRSVAKDLLKHAHSHCVGQYEAGATPTLTVTFTSTLYDGPSATHTFDLLDLMSMSGLAAEGYPSNLLRSVGPFDFDLYWFNRQRLRAIEGVGDRERVRSLVRAWNGICLYRDGYRVLPYGDQGDDWLELDRDALSSSGYKLNTKQLIGRVRIGRTTNPKLLDQTNRQGLVDNTEKHALIEMLNAIVSNWWRDYLNEASRVQKRGQAVLYDAAKEGGSVTNYEKRASDAIKSIRKDFSGDASLLQEVKDAFIEIKEAHSRAVAYIETIEEQKERLTQLAGVGLMIEVIAHELTRATEATEVTLKGLKPKNFDAPTQSAFKVLGEQIRVIHKRLQTLEPLSVSARQRRSTKKIYDICAYVAQAHEIQFERHGIQFSFTKNTDEDATGFVIEGHVVQILENLIDNSVYWLKLQKSEHPSFRPKITMQILSSPLRVRYEDNGPGIPVVRAEAVFDAFYSTKGGATSRRQGLGLYIARQNAELLGGSLVLTDEHKMHQGRHNTFELELKEQPE
ncbi:sensor histidine kinase [Stenotrophomonas rhizophila]|uniref:sensor histidine kinase n=1 Tax=Stenotrophomonas rhizophila TaxID=216778 RepID=UPI00339325AE